MNNRFDFIQQRLRTTESAQMDFDAAAVAYGKPLLDPKTVGVGNLHGSFLWPQSPAVGFDAAGTLPPLPKPHGFLQAINNELAANAAERERLLLTKRLAANAAERERLLDEQSSHELALLEEKSARQKMNVLNTQQKMLLMNTQQKMLRMNHHQKMIHMNNQQKVLLMNNQQVPKHNKIHELLEHDPFDRLNHHARAPPIANSGYFNGRGEREVLDVTSIPPEKENVNKEHEEAPTTKRTKSVVGDKWLAQYDRLVKYKAEHGNCIVPRGFLVDPRLAAWVAEQRKQNKLFKRGKPTSMTQDRVDLLNEIEFVWFAQEAAWERNLSDLIAFNKNYGCWRPVPVTHPTYRKLGLWVKEQRRHRNLMKQGKTSQMTDERIRRLEETGFKFEHTTRAVWGERLEELCRYKAQFGHCNVPSEHPGQLGSWVEYQRRQYKKSTEGKSSNLTPGRVQLLKSIGFDWDTTNLVVSPSEAHAPSSDSETESDSGRSVVEIPIPANMEEQKKMAS